MCLLFKEINKWTFYKKCHKKEVCLIQKKSESVFPGKRQEGVKCVSWVPWFPGSSKERLLFLKSPLTVKRSLVVNFIQEMVTLCSLHQKQLIFCSFVYIFFMKQENGKGIIFEVNFNQINFDREWNRCQEWIKLLFIFWFRSQLFVFRNNSRIWKDCQRWWKLSGGWHQRVKFVYLNSS